MTVSTHVYTAEIIGTPDIPLRIKGGRISLDAARAPHVQGDIEIAIPAHQQFVDDYWPADDEWPSDDLWPGGGLLGWEPDQAILEALDPRLSPRIRVTVAATFPSGGQTRTFELGLRGRPVRHRAGTVSLSLASDEALLIDYAALADDLTPLEHQDSLRGLVNYVLGTAIPGAALNTSLSAPDVPVPAFSDSVNLMRNPRALQTWDYQWGVTSGTVNVGTSLTGGPSYAPSYWWLVTTSTVTGGYHYYTETELSVSGNEDYVASVDVRIGSGVSVQIDAVIFDGSGNVVGYATPVFLAGNNAWQRRAVPFYAPPTAASVRPRVLFVGTVAASTAMDVTAWRLSKATGDPADIGYFDGDTPDTAAYQYEHANGASVSNSSRKVLVDAATPDALTWQAGDSALDFLSPLIQRFGLRLVCDEAGVWTLRGQEFLAGGSLSIRHGVNLIDATESIDRDGMWFDARVTIYTWTDRATGAQYRRVDSFALNMPPTKVDTVRINAAYPGPGRSAFAVNRMQGRGREVTATSVANWTAKAEQSITVILNGSPQQVGTTQSVTFDLDQDEMTVNVRTVENGVGSIALLTGSIDALVGTIDGL